MPDYAIVTDELHRLTVRVIPVGLVIFGLLVLLGQPLGQVALGVFAGTAFALWNFYLMGRSAVRAACQTDPARASKIVSRSYAKRYALTALFLLAVVWTSWMSVPAVVLPLFSPKITLMISNYFGRKEENHK